MADNDPFRRRVRPPFPHRGGMTNADPTQTVHFRLARTRLGKLSDNNTDRVEQLENSVRQETDPELRARYAIAVLVGWLRLTYWCTVGMVVTGFPLGWLLGRAAVDVVLAIWAVPCFFCIAGAFNVLWRYYWFVGQARRWARLDGAGSARFAASMRRTLPRDSSLIWQVAAGVLASVIVVATA